MSDLVTKFDLERALKQRDLIFLSDQISNESLSPEVRVHLAGIIRGLLTGEVKIPKHRPKTSHSTKKTWKIALRVVELRRSGWDKIGAAVKKAAEEFHCSETKVWGCLRQFREVLREIERDEPFNLYYEWRREEERREERREEERREEERQEEERREEEWREQWNEAEAYLIETQGYRDYTDKEIEDAMALLENERRHYK
jgi:hypothetical protein